MLFTLEAVNRGVYTEEYSCSRSTALPAGLTLAAARIEPVTLSQLNNNSVEALPLTQGASETQMFHRPKLDIVFPSCYKASGSITLNTK